MVFLSQLQAVCPLGLSLQVTAHLGNHLKLVARVVERALDSGRAKGSGQAHLVDRARHDRHAANR